MQCWQCAVRCRVGICIALQRIAMLTKRPRSICLFGTSADPPTGIGGHRGIAMALSNLLLSSAERQPVTSESSGSTCVESNDSDTNDSSQQFRFDEIRVVPVYRHMFASKRGKQASYDDRLEMCRLAFEGIERVTVSDCERRCFDLAAKGLNNDDEKSSVRVGTADLLDMLLDEEPDTNFSFALGADTFMDLTTFKWRRSHDVLDLVGGRLMVIYRQTESTESRYCEKDLQSRIDMVNKQRCHEAKGQEEDAALPADGPAMLLKPDLQAISSSLARSTTDEAILSRLLEPKVLQYIKEKGFYAFVGQSSS